MAKAGDKVKVVCKDEEITGVLMPSEAADSVIVKLDNGYNMVIDRKKIKEIKVIEALKDGREKISEKAKQNPKLPTIAILHTGGTIASKVDYGTGGVIAKFSAEDLTGMFPELAEIANIETELVANMMSEDMRFSDHQKIALAIKRHAGKGVKGVIVGHGTDTLGYTAASLALMFEKIDIPVLLVGSQRSSDRGSTDAAVNLICAAKFITKTDFKGVAVCMHHSSSDDRCAILPAMKTRKMHTSRRDAFKAINGKPIAIIDYKTGKIEFIERQKPDSEGLLLKEKMENDVGLIKTHPNMLPELFDFYSKNYKGIVMEVTGLGQAPTNLGEPHINIYNILKDYISKGGIVLITSQCINGRVHPNIYTNCRRLVDIGCIFCEDMIAETAFVKLAWLLGNYPKEKVKELIVKNLRGEISERTEYGEDFLK